MQRLGGILPIRLDPASKIKIDSLRLSARKTSKLFFDPATLCLSDVLFCVLSVGLAARLSSDDIVAKDRCRYYLSVAETCIGVPE
jgi:hypothetical protein